MINQETEQRRAPGNTDTGRGVQLVVMAAGLTVEAFIPPDSLKIASEITLGAAAVAPFVQGFIRDLIRR